jgi:hypothetical protein
MNLPGPADAAGPELPERPAPRVTIDLGSCAFLAGVALVTALGCLLIRFFKAP